ncbi:MAG: hypothetical protein ABI534_10855 [Chloroflexota bacterium]
MNTTLKLGLAAVAMAVAVLIGINYFGSGTSNVGGSGTGNSTSTPGPTATVEASPTASPTPVPTPAGLLPETRYALVTADVPLTVTIPATDWFGDPGNAILVKNDDAGAPSGAGMIVFAGDDLFVYGDPCRWSTTTPETPVTTVDGLVAALTAQASRDATLPVDVTVGGYAGKSITLHVPSEAVFADCDRGYFGSWAVRGEVTPSRYHQDPGQIDKLWIVDIDGQLVVIDGAYYAATPRAVVDELEAIVESATFE